MITATINQTASVGGLSIQGNVVREADSQIGYSSDPALPAAIAGALTTRTGDDEGVITTPAAHGITNGTIDVFWPGGLRRGMGVTAVTETTITFGGEANEGAGDNLPAGPPDPAVTVAVPVKANIPAFDGDDIKVIAAGCASRACVQFMDDGDLVLLAVDLSPGEMWSWADGQGVNPLDDDDVDHLLVSNGDAGRTAEVRVGVALDAQE